MKNTTNTTNTNNTVTTENNTTKGEKNMKKTIKEIRAEELKAREEAAKQQQEEEVRQAHIAELEALPEKDSVATMPEVREGALRSDRDENGRCKGVNGGKYFTKMVNGQLITAETKEGLAEAEERVKNGIRGDGFLYKDVIILGHRFTLTGRNEEELDEDLRRAEVDIYSHRDHFMFDVETAEDFLESGYTEQELEEVEVQGYKFLISYPEFRAIDMEFEKYATAVEVTDMPSIVKGKNREEIKKLLLERLENYVEEKELDEDDEDFDYDEDAEDLD